MAQSIQDKAIAKLDAEIADYERVLKIVKDADDAGDSPRDYLSPKIADLYRAKALIVAAFADVTDPVTAAPKAKRGRKKKGLPAGTGGDVEPLKF